jgi:hypothetical protein
MSGLLPPILLHEAQEVTGMKQLFRRRQHMHGPIDCEYWTPLRPTGRTKTVLGPPCKSGEFIECRTWFGWRYWVEKTETDWFEVETVVREWGAPGRCREKQAMKPEDRE